MHARARLSITVISAVTAVTLAACSPDGTPTTSPTPPDPSATSTTNADSTPSPTYAPTDAQLVQDFQLSSALPDELLAAEIIQRFSDWQSTGTLYGLAPDSAEADEVLYSEWFAFANMGDGNNPQNEQTFLSAQLDRTNQDYSAALFGPAVSSDQDLAQVATSEERQQDAYLTEVLNSVDHPPLLTAFLQYDSSTTTTTPSGKTMEISYTLRSNGAASQTTADVDASEAATPTGLTGPDGLKGGITVTLRQSGDHDLITHVDQGID